MLKNTQVNTLVLNLFLFGIGIIFSCNVFGAKPSDTYATKIELGEESSIREGADLAQIDRIDGEVIERTNNDATLQANINSEAATREAADNTLQINIGAEAVSRTSNDLALQGQISSNSDSIIDGAEAICQLFTLHPEITPPIFCDATPPPVVTEHIIFVSQTQTTGFISSEIGGALSNAALICDSEATSAGLSGQFYPWLSPSNSSLLDWFSLSIMDDSVAFILPSGILVAENWTQLTSGTLQHKIDEYVTGQPVPPSSVMWTNTFEDGRIYSNHPNWTCNDFTSELSSDVALVGSSEHFTEEWSRFALQSCDQPANLICVQQTTTAD